MKMKRHGILYLIADRRQGDRKILEALDAGVDIVQLREKERNSAEYLEDAVWLGREAGKRGILFLVNDRLDIALASGADGIHLGQDDLPVRQARQIAERCGLKNFIVGATARTREQAVRALKDGADYLGSGAWYSTETKPGAALITDATYREILASADIANVAIGGLTPENCGRPLELGADGLAVSAGILSAPGVKESVLQFKKKLSEYWPLPENSRIECKRKAGM